MLKPSYDLSEDTTISTSQDIPKEMDIFCRFENAFFDPNKTFDELSLEEQEMVRLRYRFDPFKPGIYQGITGIVKGANKML